MAPASGHDDLPARRLDDFGDREELRQRYYGLLQELRVLLPGVQVLVAFLLTIPFASRFGELDAAERAAFVVSLLAGLVAVVSLVSPTVLHRVSTRTARVGRLRWATRLLVLGVMALAVSLLSGLLCVAHFVFGPTAAAWMTLCLAGLMAALWIVLPAHISRTAHHRPEFDER